MKQELATLGKAWERGKLNRPASREGEFSLEKVEGPIKTTEAIAIQPGETKRVSRIASFRGNSKRINVFTEPLVETTLEEEKTWLTIPSYSECKNGSSRISVAIRNNLRKVVIIAKGQQIAKVSAANQVPNMLAPKYMNSTLEHNENLTVNESREKVKQIEKLWEQLDVTGSDSWTENQKSKLKKVFEDYNDVFALNPLELGRTSLVKHTIKVIDPKPFRKDIAEYHLINMKRLENT